MVGQKIKAYLEDHGIKSSFLSEKTGITRPILSSILCGTRKIEVMEYYRICRALNVDLMTFISDCETEI